MSTSKPLIIVNASAGSGKTYRLVKEYIKMLLDESDSILGFSSILAMTFTNMAALEMKERIINGLDEISNADRFENKQAHLTTVLAAELGISPDQVIERSAVVLKQILHRYEDFHVMTIDKFNLRLIKSFSRDLDLPKDFEVILQEDELIENVVDELLNKLGDQQHRETNELLLNYAKQNLDEESNWNFRNNLIEFSNVLQPEKHQAIIGRLMESDLSTDRFEATKKLYHEINGVYRVLIEQLKITFSNEVSDAGVLPGGSNSYNAIQKIIESNTFPSGELFTPSHYQLIREGNKSKSYPPATRELLLKLHAYWEKHVYTYLRIGLFRKDYFNMSLLKHLALALDDAKKTEQILRISEFNALISKLIRDEEAPFIYERVGNRFKHFMLDEFQDTSHLQWLNMIPLIHESIGKNNLNLIVGDPKQSIYRFKNGVAEQFIALPRIYNPEHDPKIAMKSDYFKAMGEVQILNENWRSSEVIVNFNNAFFAHFRSKLSETSSEFYSATEQRVMRDLPGLVSIESVPEKPEPGFILERIVSLIEACLADGYQHKDICILGGRNLECNEWAIGLNEKNYKVVSADSLLIYRDLGVQLAIAYLKLRLRPSGDTELKRFIELYFRQKDLGYDAYNAVLFSQEPGDTKRRNSRVDRHRFFTTYFGAEDRFFFNYEHLYDLINKFYVLAGLHELQNPYLHHLSDFVYGYSMMKGPDLKRFLDAYEKQKMKLAIQIPESDDAIKIMTIHKSKGLEFPVVIIPSLAFSMEIKNKQLFESGNFVFYKKPNSSDLLPELKALKEQEEEHILIDNTNLAYVGLTRPKERLYILNYFEPKRFGATFHAVLRELNWGEIDGERIRYFHQKGTTQKTQDTRSAGISDSDYFVPEDIRDNLWFPDIALRELDSLEDEEFISDEMLFGTQFHELICAIDKPEQLASILNQAILTGKIELSRAEVLKEALAKLLDSEEYQRLISGHSYVLNEASILTDKNETLRPDKVIIKPNETIVIDFKTGARKAKDQGQVRKYRALLASMNYPAVSAYLYYTSENVFELVS